MSHLTQKEEELEKRVKELEALLNREKSKKSTLKAWRDYRKGEHVSTPDMERMLQEVEDAMPFLTHNPDMGCAHFMAAQDMAALKSYLHYRKSK